MVESADLLILYHHITTLLSQLPFRACRCSKDGVDVLEHKLGDIDAAAPWEGRKAVALGRCTCKGGVGGVEGEGAGEIGEGRGRGKGGGGGGVRRGQESVGSVLAARGAGLWSWAGDWDGGRALLAVPPPEPATARSPHTFPIPTAHPTCRHSSLCPLWTRHAAKFPHFPHTPRPTPYLQALFTTPPVATTLSPCSHPTTYSQAFFAVPPLGALRRQVPGRRDPCRLPARLPGQPLPNSP